MVRGYPTVVCGAERQPAAGQGFPGACIAPACPIMGASRGFIIVSHTKTRHPAHTEGDEPFDEAVPCGPLPDHVLRQFRSIARSVSRHVLAVERQCGISGSQLTTLAIVRSRTGIRVTELAQSLSLHQSTASNLVDQLARRGLIERRRSESDLRVVQLHCTAQGNALLEQAPKPLEGLLAHALCNLDSATLAGLHDCLSRLIDVMEPAATRPARVAQP